MRLTTISHHISPYPWWAWYLPFLPLKFLGTLTAKNGSSFFRIFKNLGASGFRVENLKSHKGFGDARMNSEGTPAEHRNPGPGILRVLPWAGCVTTSWQKERCIDSSTTSGDGKRTGITDRFCAPTGCWVPPPRVWQSDSRGVLKERNTVIVWLCVRSNNLQGPVNSCTGLHPKPWQTQDLPPMVVNMVGGGWQEVTNTKPRIPKAISFLSDHLICIGKLITGLIRLPSKVTTKLTSPDPASDFGIGPRFNWCK